MKTKYIAILMTIFAMGSSGLCQNPWEQIGFIEKIVQPGNEIYKDSYLPKLRLIGDTLYVASNSGLYRKDLRLPETEFELCAFAGLPVIDFVKNGDRYLALSERSRQLNDSMLFYSEDGGQTYRNITPPEFVITEYAERNVMFRFIQNPENPSSLIVSSLYGLFRSFDFGENWKGWGRQVKGVDPEVSYHPLDTTVIFYAGGVVEAAIVAGIIKRSEDNGENWDDHWVDGGAGCVFDIAYHPRNADVLVCTDYGGVVGKSTDKGKNWRRTNRTHGRILTSLFFNEKKPDTLYGIRWFRVSDDEWKIFIARSIDEGENWDSCHEAEYDWLEKGGLFDEIYYNNQLLIYTQDAGIFALDFDPSPLSIEKEVAEQKLIIYPNPVQDVFYFETSEEVKKIEIMDISGRVVRSERLSGSTDRIDVSSLRSGMYIVCFHIANGQVIKKKISII